MGCSLCSCSVSWAPHILWLLILYRRHSLHTVSPCSQVPLHCDNCFLGWAEASQFDVTPLVHFCFYCLSCLGIIQEVFTEANVPCVFLWWVIISGLECKCLTDFELILVNGYKIGVGVKLGIEFQNPLLFVEETILSQGNNFGLFVRG